MSSEGSVSTNGSSRIRQFGLYRTIDAKTEEFLRLSRKRQIKQGCACAAISTAVTVTVVIVILLIYEYAIAIESNLVQIKERDNRRNSIVNITDDSPVADRLDRSYFGFDQDYYERMPLLVNAMQENSYVDPALDATLENKEPQLIAPKSKSTKLSSINNFRPSQLRRTSPRPFIFEYKSPTPVPFSKTYGSKSWIESYRNAQRLQNIQQVIKYLEKTINAKIGDMYTVPTNKHIAFTGVYVEPQEKSQNSGSKHANFDLPGDNSKRVDIFQSNHKSDPLFKYKPDSPGEVNLLADGFLRFSPTFVGRNEYSKVPLFRPIPNRKRYCNGRSCENIIDGILDTQPTSSESRVPDSSSFSKAKTFSVMLNLFPLKNNLKHGISNLDTEKRAPIDNIYLTTSKPLVLFKKKSTTTKRRNIIKRPRILKENKHFTHNVDHELGSQEKINESSSGSKMIVQINLYTPEKREDFTTQINNNITDLLSSTTQDSNFIPISPYSTEIPINLSTSQVEDFHVGSSGIVPFEARTLFPPTPPPPTLPQVTTTIPFYDVTLSSTEGAWYTKPPDILKFSHEDAKIPEEYMRYRELDYPENLFPITNRRNFRSHLDIDDIENQTLIFKLGNDIKSTTLDSIVKEISEDINEATTATSTTTQINGHYRSNYRNSKIINSLLDPNSETNRKRRLNLLAKGFRRPDFSLSYTEIKRNKSQSVNDNNEE